MPPGFLRVLKTPVCMEHSLYVSIRNLWGAHGSESRGRNGAAEARKCSP